MSDFPMKPGNFFMLILVIVLMGVGALLGLRSQLSAWTTSAEIFFIIAIVVASVIWQIILVKNDSSSNRLPRRIVGSGIYSAVIMLGILGYSIYSFNDASKNYSLMNIFNNLGKAVILCLMFTFKSYFGPVFLGGTLAVSIFYTLHTGVISISAIPVISAIVNWVFSNVPEHIKNMYYVGLALYALYFSVVDTADDYVSLRDWF